MTSLRLTLVDGSAVMLADADLAAQASSDGILRIDRLLDAHRASEKATHCTAISEQGTYRASIPIEDIRSGGELAVRRSGQPIDRAVGGPYRLTVVDGSTLCWNVKAVEELRLSVGPLDDDVPENPPH